MVYNRIPVFAVDECQKLVVTTVEDQGRDIAGRRGKGIDVKGTLVDGFVVNRP